MQKVVLVPKRLHPARFEGLRAVGADVCLGGRCWYELLRDEMGFKIIYADTIAELPSDTEIVWCAFRNLSFPDLGSLKPGIKLFSCLGDLHGGHRKWYESHPATLERSDVIFSDIYAEFEKALPQYLHKYVFWPHSFKPHEAYASLSFNENPIMKCIMPGRIGSSYYRLRTEISMKVAHGGRWREIIDTVKHYWYDRGRKTVYEWEREPACGAKYAKLLNEYFCGLSTPSSVQYFVGKCVEIPAAGALLLTQETRDIEKARLVPWKHYVPVAYEKESIFKQVTECLAHPDKYQSIRKEGMEFVRANHSVRTRLEQFEEILRSV